MLLEGVAWEPNPIEQDPDHAGHAKLDCLTANATRVL